MEERFHQKVSLGKNLYSNTDGEANVSVCVAETFSKISGLFHTYPQLKALIPWLTMILRDTIISIRA